jgi:hypothetical protein
MILEADQPTFVADFNVPFAVSRGSLDQLFVIIVREVNAALKVS